METKQTAVEWLVEQLTFPEYGDHQQWIQEVIEQAKKMEAYEAKILARKYFLKGFETAETTEKQPVPHEQTMRDAESFFELIYPMQDERKIK